MLIMYAITSIICSIQSSGIEVKNDEALKQTVNVIKLIFTPTNALMLLAVLGNTFGKLKDKVIEEEKAKKRLIIILIAFIVILFFESNYIRNFITGVLQI